MAIGDYSPASTLVTVIGGSGFIGRHVVRALAREGYRIRVAVRRPDLANHLQPLGAVGQIHAVQANIRFPQSLDAAVAGAAAVVNLVGILAQSGRQTFDAVQARGPEAVAAASRRAGVARLVQMSAIGADAGSASAYAATKARGEAAAFGSGIDAVVLRPSVVFGPEDQFFNRFANLARTLPVIPLVGGDTRFQPVFVGDVAQAVTKAVAGTLAAGRVYELGGPEVRTLREIVADILTLIGRRRPVIDLPWGAANLQAGVIETVHRFSMGLFPDDFLITRDQVELLRHDNVVSQAAIDEGRTLPGMGIEPTSYGAVVPGYLWRYRKSGQFDTARVG